MHALVQTASDIPSSDSRAKLERSTLDEAAIGLIRMADLVFGGFGQAPKFPNVSNLLFLLRYYDISGINRFKDFVIFSAEKMAVLEESTITLVAVLQDIPLTKDG